MGDFYAKAVLGTGRPCAQHCSKITIKKSLEGNSSRNSCRELPDATFFITHCEIQSTSMSAERERMAQHEPLNEKNKTARFQVRTLNYTVRMVEAE